MHTDQIDEQLTELLQQVECTILLPGTIIIQHSGTVFVFFVVSCNEHQFRIVAHHDIVSVS